MAKKKSKGVSKSQAVRDYLSEHPGATASVVIPDLASRGIKVSVALVGQIKQRMKKSGESGGQKSASAPAKKSTAKKAAKKRASKKATATKATRSTSKAVTADDLMEAKKLVDELGGIDQARKALKYLEELG